MNPVPDMPFTDEQWRRLAWIDRRRCAEVWMRRAQPLPAQRRRLAPPTVEGAWVIHEKTRRALGHLIALQSCEAPTVETPTNREAS